MRFGERTRTGEPLSGFGRRPPASFSIVATNASVSTSDGFLYYTYSTPGEYTFNVVGNVYGFIYMWGAGGGCGAVNT